MWEMTNNNLKSKKNALTIKNHDKLLGDTVDKSLPVYKLFLDKLS